MINRSSKGMAVMKKTCWSVVVSGAWKISSLVQSTSVPPGHLWLPGQQGESGAPAEKAALML